MSKEIRKYISAQHDPESAPMYLISYAGLHSPNGDNQHINFSIGNKHCCMSSAQLLDMISTITMRLMRKDIESKTIDRDGWRCEKFVTFEKMKCPYCGKESTCRVAQQIGAKWVCPGCLRVIGLLQHDEEFRIVITDLCMRSPKLNETLLCPVCGCEDYRADNKFLDKFHSMTLAQQIDIYDPMMDKYLSYDGCEEHQEV